MKRKVILVVTIIIGLAFACFLFLTSCNQNTPPFLATNDIIVEGIIHADECIHFGKCISFYKILPQGFDLHYHNMSEIMLFNNQSVIIEGNLMSKYEIYSCEKDYYDGLQHPINLACKDKRVKYYTVQNILEIKSIKLKQE